VTCLLKVMRDSAEELVAWFASGAAAAEVDRAYPRRDTSAAR
jgi:hypothetical protein